MNCPRCNTPMQDAIQADIAHRWYRCPVCRATFGMAGAKPARSGTRASTRMTPRAQTVNGRCGGCGSRR